MTPEDIAECVGAVKEASAHLQRTPSNSHMLTIDRKREQIVPVSRCLKGLERAEFAVGVWRYCLHRGMYSESIDMLIESRASTGPHPLALRVEACLAIGVLSRRLGYFWQAERSLEHAWRLAQDLDASCDKAFILFHFATLYRMAGRYEEALSYLEKSITFGCDTNDEWILAVAHLEMGTLFLVQRRLDEADKALSFSLKKWEIIGDASRTLDVLINRAIIAGERGNYIEAEKTYQRCLHFCRILNDPDMSALCSHNLGDICVYTDKLVEARQHLIRAYEQWHKVGNQQSLFLTISAMAVVCFKEENYRTAIRFFALAERLTREAGFAASALESEDIVRTISALREKVKPAQFSRAWKQGDALTLDTVISLFNAIRHA